MLNEAMSKVLIIDDEEVVLDSCTQILEGEPYHAATAMDGAFGLELVREFHPDVVFVDLKMPGISGFEVLEKIFEFDPTIVTVVITGYATVDSAVEAIKKGAYDFLPKPFTPDEFRIITQRSLERRRLVLETTALRHEREMLREHFAAIVSHELKAPLGAVQQNLFALEHELSDQLEESQAARLGRMKASIDNLLKLIHTWLRVISTDIQALQENFHPTAITDVITKAVESVEPHATRKDIEISTSFKEGLNLIQGDDVTLGEAIVNIVNNAIKYSRMGSKIRIEATTEEEEILISVTDRGVGIAEEDLPFIFGDFYVARSAPESERGSGLGLAITRRIIEAHGGSISVESALEKGSTFMIRLPVMGTEVNAEPAEDAGILANSM
ncbi:MAG: hybrid sensor histidine kinase/response regulator [Anaerolineales bacterium]|nr:hybrid sensor histidine kinase/response regulator [Anaerolineales bacterium]